MRRQIEEKSESWRMDQIQINWVANSAWLEAGVQMSICQMLKERRNMPTLLAEMRQMSLQLKMPASKMTALPRVWLDVIC
jgi:hypothetical protein